MTLDTCLIKIEAVHIRRKYSSVCACVSRDEEDLDVWPGVVAETSAVKAGGLVRPRLPIQSKCSPCYCYCCVKVLHEYSALGVFQKTMKKSKKTNQETVLQIFFTVFYFFSPFFCVKKAFRKRNKN
jgi:hypothetical protein